MKFFYKNPFGDRVEIVPESNEPIFLQNRFYRFREKESGKVIGVHASNFDVVDDDNTGERKTEDVGYTQAS